MGNGHAGRMWMPLDNAALIFPAIRRKNWNNVFRESVTLTEDVDPQLLQRAVDQLMPGSPPSISGSGGAYSGTIWRRSRRRPGSRRTMPTP